MGTGTGKALIFVTVLRSKLATARLNVAQDHRMVRILNPILTGYTTTRGLGRGNYRPTCPACKPATNKIRQTTRSVFGEYHGAKSIDP